VRGGEYVHVWYAMDLAAADAPKRPLEPELELRRGGGDDMWLLEQLPLDPHVSTMTPWLVQDWLGSGGSLWLVQNGDRAALRCWVFRDWCPMGGAPGGGIRPPSDAVVVKDVMTSPEFRGRGVAPAAWAAIADAYREDGSRWMYIRVDSNNDPSRRAIEKAGFREVARVHTRWRYWWRTTRLSDGTGEPAHGWLQQLVRA